MTCTMPSKLPGSNSNLRRPACQKQRSNCRERIPSPLPLGCIGLLLGPLFLRAYPLASRVAALRGMPAYRGNWFEVQAYRAQAARDEAR